jgi:hypothetical protein
VPACDAFWKGILDGLSGVKAVQNKQVPPPDPAGAE